MMTLIAFIISHVLLYCFLTAVFLETAETEQQIKESYEVGGILTIFWPIALFVLIAAGMMKVIEWVGHRGLIPVINLFRFGIRIATNPAEFKKKRKIKRAAKMALKLEKRRRKEQVRWIKLTGKREEKLEALDSRFIWQGTTLHGPKQDYIWIEKT